MLGTRHPYRRDEPETTPPVAKANIVTCGSWRPRMRSTSLFGAPIFTPPHPHPPPGASTFFSSLLVPIPSFIICRVLEQQCPTTTTTTRRPVVRRGVLPVPRSGTVGSRSHHPSHGLVGDRRRPAELRTWTAGSKDLKKSPQGVPGVVVRTR